MKKKAILIISFMFFLMFLFSSQVFGFTIVLDPGHGGADPGSIAENGELEKDLNLKIALYLKEYLSDYEVDVYMTHNGFDGYDYSIFDRAIFAREKNADLVLSLHLNSSEQTANGAEVWVTGNTSLDKYNKNLTALGNKVLANLENLGIEKRGVYVSYRENDPTELYSDGTKADYYGIICYCMRGCRIDNGVITPEGAIPAKVEEGEGVPAAIIEHCFLTEGDYEFVSSDAALRNLAIADGKAVVEQYGLTKKKEAGETPFQDVYKSDWFHNAVKYTYENGIIQGATSTTFKPESKLTRGMLVTILYRMEGAPTITGNVIFTDITNKNLYYYYAVKWAADKKIVSGYNNGKFGPDDNITREQLAVMLNNYCRYKKKYKATSADLSEYTDYSKVSTYARTAMNWAVANKVVTGSNNKLNPQGNASRAEAASMIYKYCMNIK